jgi:hypothetical protein
VRTDFDLVFIPLQGCANCLSIELEFAARAGLPLLAVYVRKRRGEHVEI